MPGYQMVLRLVCRIAHLIQIGFGAAETRSQQLVVLFQTLTQLFPDMQLVAQRFPANEPSSVQYAGDEKPRRTKWRCGHNFNCQFLLLRIRDRCGPDEFRHLQRLLD